MASSTKTASELEAVDLLAGQLAYSATGDTVPFKLWSITKRDLEAKLPADQALAPLTNSTSKHLRSYFVRVGKTYRKGSRKESLCVRTLRQIRKYTALSALPDTNIYPLNSSSRQVVPAKFDGYLCRFCACKAISGDKFESYRAFTHFKSRLCKKLVGADVDIFVNAIKTVDFDGWRVRQEAS